VARTYDALFAAYPDIRDRIEVMIVEGDRVAVRFVATSRSGGLTRPVQAMMRVRHGLIVENHTVFDTGGEPCQP
jgi:predicted ester cyclase